VGAKEFDEVKICLAKRITVFVVYTCEFY